MRKRVAQEILETEKSYNASLHNLVNEYIVPMRTSNILSHDEEQIVFAGCMQIVGLSDQLLATLAPRLAEWDVRTSTIGDIFSFYSEFLKLYIPFSNNFAKGNEILQHKEIDHIAAAASTRGVSGLLSLRIQPIQRIPRYVLLMKELLKHTHEQHPDHMFVHKALEDVQEVADHIDARMSANEKEAKVLEIQSNLWVAMGEVPTLVAPGRTLVMEGPVTKVRPNGTVNKNYYLFAFNDILVLATTNSLFGSKYYFRRTLDYHGAIPADDEATRLGVVLKFGESAFKVTGASGYRIFVVSSDAKRREWIQALTSCSQEKDEKRKSWGRARGEFIDSDEDE